MRLLIIEDEQALADMVAQHLRTAGSEIDVCYDGDSGLEAATKESYDLIILDLNLPKMDGMELLKELRTQDGETGVLILSARSGISDKVEGLDAGANDFLSKPFHMQELDARIRSLTRRKFIQNSLTLTLGQLMFDTKSRIASVDGVPLS